MSQNWTYSEASRELDRIINSASSPILLSSKKPPASLTKSIHFLDADTPMKEVRNLFSSPSSLNRSANNSNTVSSTASSHHITSTSFTDTMHLLEAKHSATSVVSAFRELQNKVKLIESERTSALRVRDELRQSLTDAKKNSALDKSRHELRNTEQILVLRQQISEVADEKVYLEETLKRAVDREKQSSDCLSERKKTLVALQDKTREQEEHEMHLQMRIDSTAKELSCVLRRCDAINYQISLGAPAASPSSVRPSTLSQRLEEMQEQLREESNLVIRYDASIGSLTEYLKLLIDLNNSLLAAVSSSRSLRKQTQLEYEINLLLLAAQKLGISRESGDSQVDPKLLKAPHIYDNALISAATRAATSTRRKPPKYNLKIFCMTII